MNDQFFLDLIAAYQQAELDLLDIIKRYVESGKASDVDKRWASQKLADIRRLQKDLATVVNKLSTLDSAAQAALRQAFLAGATGVSEGAFLGSNGAALRALTAAYLRELQQARFQILRQALDAYRRIVGEVVKGVAGGTATRLEVAREALRRFAQDGITAFVSRDGRRYEIASYVEMATRTGSLNAFREGRSRSIAFTGGDLVIISSVPNPSPQCKPHERNVFSLSGDDKRYPSLSSAKADGLFHPNCRHSFTKYIPGLTKPGETDADKGFDDYEATQEQRLLERKIRAQKRILAVDPENARAKEKIKGYQEQLRELTKEYDLVRKTNRESNAQAR